MGPAQSDPAAASLLFSTADGTVLCAAGMESAATSPSTQPMTRCGTHWRPGPGLGTCGSMTTLIDRLERAGYVWRRDDRGHGKRKLITATPRLAGAITPVMRARQAEGTRELSSQPTTDLRVILRFLQATLAGKRQSARPACRWPRPGRRRGVPGGPDRAGRASGHGRPQGIAQTGRRDVP